MRQHRLCGGGDSRAVLGEIARPEVVRKARPPVPLERLDEGNGSLPPRLVEHTADDAGEGAVGIDRVRLLPAGDERQHAIGGVLADPEAEPSAVRRAGEVRPLDSSSSRMATASIACSGIA